VNPGDKVAIFLTAAGYTRLLLPNIQIIGAGTTTMVATTTTDPAGAQSTDQLPKTLLTLAVSQAEAERILFASTSGELAFGLMTPDSQIAASKGVTSTNLFQ
jgi:pilus assembly protein CpaB